jgi:tetratricopeptide (TPR) repeat protein
VAALETLLLLFAVVVSVAAGGLVWVALRGRPGGDPAGAALSGGDFGLALALGEAPGGGRREWLAAATAARHLLLFDRAEELLGRLLAADPEDAEARIERALLAAWQRRGEAASEDLARALARRPDLAEPIALHRAFTAWRQGDAAGARLRFEEIAAALESKLRADLGPGDGLFADWFLEAALLWAASGDEARAAWAGEAFGRSAPQSRLRGIA